MSAPLLEGNEPIVDLLVARLEEQLPMLVDELNARDTKGIRLDVPKVLDFVPPPASLVGLPIVAVQDGAQDLEDDIGASATEKGTLVVVVFEQEHDQQVLATKLRRHIQAVRSAVLWTRRLQAPDGSGAWGLVDRGIRPGPTLGAPENPRDWLSYAAFAVEYRAEVWGD
jgi:hypothetical protein